MEAETLEQVTKFVTLKLARSAYPDFADVVNLIREHQLDAGFQERLPPSIRRDFIECLEEIRRDEAWEARLDQAVLERMAAEESPGNKGDS